MNIVLAGMPGSGKSTLAKVFKADGKTVYDTDTEIVKAHGTISGIFEKYGEERFREFETQAVEKLCTLDGAVIATGGGCLLRPVNVELFRRGGCKIVYLRASYKTLLKRVSGNKERPLLIGNTADKLKKLYDERTPLYEAAADIIIDTDGLTPEQTVKKITEKLI